MFDHKLRMLAFVERWNIAPRLHRQSVAEHSYFVTLYASILGERMGLSPFEQMTLLKGALHHDMPEYRSSDMPGPTKRAVVDPEKLAAYEKEAMAAVGRDGCDQLDPYLKKIVKAADTVDAYIWVSMELAHGNRMLRREREFAYERMDVALTLIGFPGGAQEVAYECEHFFNGVELAPRLDTDLGPVSLDGAYAPDAEIPF